MYRETQQRTHYTALTLLHYVYVGVRCLPNPEASREKGTKVTNYQ